METAAKHVKSGQAAGTVIAISDTSNLLKFLALLNTTAAVAYLQIFNLPAASVTLGTTVPKLSIGLPASAAMSLPIALGLKLDGQGISIAGTTTRTGSTGAAIDYNLGWG